MKYERHTPQFDNIVEIEAIDPADFLEAAFMRRIDGMEEAALGEVAAMVRNAKWTLKLISNDTEPDLDSALWQLRNLGRYPQSALYGHPQHFQQTRLVSMPPMGQQLSGSLFGALGGAWSCFG